MPKYKIDRTYGKSTLDRKLVIKRNVTVVDIKELGEVKSCLGAVLERGQELALPGEMIQAFAIEAVIEARNSHNPAKPFAYGDVPGELARRHAAGELVTPDDRTMLDWVDIALESRGRGKSDHTKRGHTSIRQRIRCYPIAKKRMQKVTLPDILNFIETMQKRGPGRHWERTKKLTGEPLGAKAIGDTLMGLNWAFSRAKLEGYMTKNPLDDLRANRDLMPVMKQVPVAKDQLLSQDEIDAVLASFNMENRPTGMTPEQGDSFELMAHLLLTTGPRLSELLGISMCDIHLDTEVPRIDITQRLIETPASGKNIVPGTKSRSGERALYLSPECVMFCHRQIEVQRARNAALPISVRLDAEELDLLFSDWIGRPVSKSYVATRWSAIASAATGRRITVKMARHTVGSLIATSPNSSVSAAAAALGHSDSRITAKYYVTVPEEARIEAFRVVQKAVSRPLLRSVKKASSDDE